jgi:hypothetical protein
MPIVLRLEPDGRHFLKDSRLAGGDRTPNVAAAATPAAHDNRRGGPRACRERLASMVVAAQNLAFRPSCGPIPLWLPVARRAIARALDLDRNGVAPSAPAAPNRGRKGRRSRAAHAIPPGFCYVPPSGNQVSHDPRRPSGAERGVDADRPSDPARPGVLGLGGILATARRRTGDGSATQEESCGDQSDEAVREPFGQAIGGTRDGGC